MEREVKDKEEKYLKPYFKFLENFLTPEKKLKVVFDFFNGAGGAIDKKFLEKQKNVEVIFLNEEVDPDFKGGGPNPLEPGATDNLSEEIKKRKADLGVAFDADGDRAFLLDDKGEVLPAFVTASLLFSQSRPPFVADELVFKSLEHTELLNNETYPSRVGTYFVKSEMKKREANMGAEFSGHYYFKDFFYSDSAILTAIWAINALSKLDQTLSDYVSNFPPQKVLNENLKIDEGIMEKMEEKLESFAKSKRIKIERREGVTLDFGKSEGWINIRKSNTEPLLRLIAGAKTAKGCRELIEEIERII